MQKIRKDDVVIVIAGKDKGKTGTITRIRDDGRVYVSGVNLIKRHTKGNPQMNQPGGIIEKEAPMQVSNVAIYNSSASKADKVGVKILEGGKKVRIFKSSGEQING